MRRQTEYLTQETDKGEKRQKEKLFSIVMISSLPVLKNGE